MSKFHSIIYNILIFGFVLFLFFLLNPKIANAGYDCTDQNNNTCSDGTEFQTILKFLAVVVGQAGFPHCPQLFPKSVHWAPHELGST